MRYYLESDGRIYLVRHGAFLDLPAKDEIPFDFDTVARLLVEPEVWFAKPRLSAHPHGWLCKDEIPRRSDVAPMVRAAVHASMPRVVVEGIYRRGEDVLLVKGSRGLTQGLWSLPGGFLQFGEDPQAGLLREIREELGVPASIDGLVAVRAKLGKHSHLHWILFFYQVSLSLPLAPNPDEIAETRFVPVSEALTLGIDDTMAGVLERL